MATLPDVLARYQLRISERRFAQLVEQALAEIGGPSIDDPSSALTTADIAALTAVRADVSPRRRQEPDPRETGVAAYTALLSDALSVAQVAERVGIDPSRVRHRLAKRQLLGIRQPRGWLLPSYQFGADGRLLPGVERVTAVLADAHPVVVARFFATPQPELVIERRRLTPRAWLESGGDPQRVAKLARSLDLVA